MDVIKSILVHNLIGLTVGGISGLPGFRIIVFFHFFDGLATIYIVVYLTATFC